MATANTRRTHDDDPNDLYNTEPVVTLAAVRQGILPVTKTYWDPCDGLGGISDVLEGEGIAVRRTDLVVYPGREPVCTPMDFLNATEMPAGTQRIIMNPPFKLNSEFLDKAASFNVPFFVFNRFNLLETDTRAGKMISGMWPLKKIYLFPYRVGCSRGVDRKPATKAVPYCWFYFVPGYAGPVEFDFVVERPDTSRYEIAPDLGLDEDDLGL